MTGRTLSAVMIAAATAAALALRLATLPGTARDGRRLWFDADSAYHMHRVARTLADFPRVPWHDPSANWPEGFRYHWPPGFDLLLAGAAWVAGAGAPSSATVAAVGAWTPAVLGAATVPAAAWLAAEAAGAAAAPWAAWTLALLPGHVLLSMAGRADHHVAETLVWALGTACALAGLRTGRRRFWIGMGLACAAAVWLWPGGEVVSLVFAAGLAAEAASAGPGRKTPSAAPGAVLGFGVALGGILPLCAASPLGRAGRWSYEELSWFQPACAAAGAVLPALVGRGVTATGRRLALAAAGAGALALLIWPGAMDSLIQGARFVLRGDPWIAFTEESEPLFLVGGEVTLRRVVGHLTPLGLALPLLWIWLVHRSRGRPGAILSAVWAAAAVGLMIAQTRFESAGVLALAVACGAGGAALAARLGRRLAVGAALLAWLPAGVWLLGLPQNYRQGIPSPADLELFDFFAGRARAPGAGGPGAVMAGPWLGHWIETYGGHPVIANSIHTNRSGNGAFAEFCLAEDEPSAAGILARRDARYVVVSDILLMDIQQAALARGVPAEEFLEPRDTIVVWKPRGRRLIASRLYLDGGRGLRRFRPVFSTREVSASSGRPKHLVYEFVP